MFDKMSKRFPRGSFVRSVGVLAGGTAGAQLITLLILPVLTRLYTPQEFEVLALFSAVLSILGVVACWRFEIAIPLAEKESSAVSLVVLAWLCTLFMSLSTTAAVLFLPDEINELTRFKLSDYLYYLPIAVFFIGSFTAFQYWSTRRKAFTRISSNRLAQSVGMSVSQVGFGYLGYTPAGLLIGALVQSGLGFINLGRVFFLDAYHELRKIRVEQLRATFSEFSRYPKYSTWEALANTAGVYLPVIIISFYSSNAEAGFLMLAMRLLSAPLGLIGSAVSQVYLSEAARKNEAGELQGFTTQTVRMLFKVSVVPIGLVAITAPFIVPLVFGQDWARTGVIISWMTPWFLLQFVASPVSMVLHVTNSQVTALLLQVFGLMFRAGVVLLAAQLYLDEILEFYAVSGFVFYAVYLVVIMNVVRKNNYE